MSRQLILAARPRTLDALVGQDKTVRAIRKHMESGRVIKNWLFMGSKGTGKTSTARVLGISYQCIHQEQFGSPCAACRKASWPVYSIPASDITGIDKLREQLEGAYLGVLGAGKYRVYIIDEVHGLSGKAQELLLGYMEDTPDTTVFILCSTRPHEIYETVRSRCVVYEFKELNEEGLDKLVARLLKFTKSKLAGDRLVEELIQQHVFSPRLVTQAVEKYLAGATPKEAAQVEGDTTVDIYTLTKAVYKGNWLEVANYLRDSKDLNPRAVRASMVAYVRAVLLDCGETDERGATIAEALGTLCSLENAPDQIILASLTVVLYRLCALFAKYPLS